MKPSLPLREAALVGCATSTGAGAVIHTAGVQAGESVVVVGCGGIGLNAVHAAHIAGAHPVVAVDPVELKLEAARRLGATDAVRSSGEGMAAAIRDVTEGGADVVIVAVGSIVAAEQAVEALGPGGTCVVVGAPPTDAVLHVDPHLLRAGEKRVIGCSYGSCNPPLDFPLFLELFEAGRFDIDKIISRVYSLPEINDAFDNLASGKDLRGIVVFDEPAGGA